MATLARMRPLALALACQIVLYLWRIALSLLLFGVQLDWPVYKGVLKCISCYNFRPIKTPHTVLLSVGTNTGQMLEACFDQTD